MHSFMLKNLTVLAMFFAIFFYVNLINTYMLYNYLNVKRQLQVLLHTHLLSKSCFHVIQQVSIIFNVSIVSVFDFFEVNNMGIPS